MSKSIPTKTQVWLRQLSWLGGVEGAAVMAVLLAVPYIVVRLVELSRGRA